MQSNEAEAISRSLEPPVLDRGRGRHAVVWIENQQVRHQVLGVVGNVQPLVFFKVKLAGNNLAKEFLLTASHERQVTREQQIDYAAHAPHVGLLIVTFSHENLWRYEKRGSALLGQCFGSVHSSRKAKVCKLDVRVIVVRHEQEILGLHVAVRNPVGVTVRHSLEHLDDEITSIGFRVRLLFTDSVKEIATAHELHDDEIAVLLVKKVNERDNVRVVEASENGDFVVNGRVVGWRQVLAKDALYGDLSAR